MISTQVYDITARTKLTQTFDTPNSPIPQAEYTFPLYESCAVVSFRYYVGKSPAVEFTIKEREHKADSGRQGVPTSDRNTRNVFRADIGNIPAGEKLTVEMEFVMELRYNAEVDGLRFMIPKSIAPRHENEPRLSGERETAENGIMISVDISMANDIPTSKSPSHEISVKPRGDHELVTMNQNSAELVEDFILVVNCSGLSQSRALVETHSIKGSNALIVTVVPKFKPFQDELPEIVFLIDRSASMRNSVGLLKSYLGVILGLLPEGVKFNIRSYGSHHGSLWEKSEPYDRNSLDKAQQYVENIKVDSNSRKILTCIKSTIEDRDSQDKPLEIIVITGGEALDTGTWFERIGDETEKGDVRLFSLGIGDVSRTVVEAMAKVGRGFAQIVSSEEDNIGEKAARMLNGCLSPHVNQYKLEWEGRPSQENQTWNPNILQAPVKLPTLPPFSRTTPYVILSQDMIVPSSVWLRGTTVSGKEVEDKIEVSISPKGNTIHQLATTNVLREVEGGTAYIFEEKHRKFEESLQAEGLELGVKYGVVSKWTTFVKCDTTG
jgi:hypothetical protein